VCLLTAVYQKNSWHDMKAMLDLRAHAGFAVAGSARIVALQTKDEAVCGAAGLLRYRLVELQVRLREKPTLKSGASQAQAEAIGPKGEIRNSSRRTAEGDCSEGGFAVACRDRKGDRGGSAER
jgi:hypothetical protein